MTILKPDQGRTLVELARATIAKRLGLKVDDVSATDDPVFHERLAAFVTLKKGGQLRGCIGNLVPVSTLIKGERDNAINAPFNHYRLSPLPQVWVKVPGIERFLSNLCNKAGISPQAWRHKKLEIEVYQAQSFGEKSA